MYVYLYIHTYRLRKHIVLPNQDILRNQQLILIILYIKAHYIHIISNNTPCVPCSYNLFTHKQRLLIQSRTMRIINAPFARRSCDVDILSFVDDKHEPYPVLIGVYNVCYLMYLERNLCLALWIRPRKARKQIQGRPTGW